MIRHLVKLECLTALLLCWLLATVFTSLKAAPPALSQDTLQTSTGIAFVKDEGTKSPQAAPMDPTAEEHGPCLSEPLHFSELPKLAPGVQVVLTRYVQFKNAGGRTVYARIFLLELNQVRANHDDVSPELAERRRAIPARLMAFGNEIAVDDPEKFVSDFDVPDHFVKLAGACRYELNLGSLTCLVQTVK